MVEHTKYACGDRLINFSVINMPSMLYAFYDSGTVVMILSHFAMVCYPDKCSIYSYENINTKLID